jgi:hypothetical protein
MVAPQPISGNGFFLFDAKRTAELDDEDGVAAEFVVRRPASSGRR